MSDWPLHKSPDNEGDQSIAPYNFVPLPDEIFCLTKKEEKTVEELHSSYDTNRHTGWIDLKIKTETHLYTRCAYDPKFGEPLEKDKTYITKEPHLQQFFHHGDEKVPFIPGSTIRGMVRSLVEILGYGKMQWVKDEKLIYRAVGDTTSLGRSYREKMMGKDQGNNKEMCFEYPHPKLKGGYLIKSGHGWGIQPAQEPNGCGESFVHVDYNKVSSWVVKGSLKAYEVYVKPSKRDKNDRGKRGKMGKEKKLFLNMAESNNVSKNAQPGFVKAKLVSSGHMEGKDGKHSKHWHCAIFEPDNSKEPIKIPHDTWQQYDEDTKLQRGEGRETRKLKDGDPLFYLLDDSDNLVFFGSTMFFRLSYEHTTQKFVPDTLQKQNGLDLAEAIFGTVKEKDRRLERSSVESREETEKKNVDAIKGRVSFEDAELTKKNENDSPFLDGPNDDGRRIPKVLSSPKPTSFQHYLVQPKEENKWNPMNYNSNPCNDKVTDGTVIRGHKLYWHKPESENIYDNVYEKSYEVRLKSDGKGVEQWDEKEKGWKDSTQHTIIRPVRSGVEFTSRINFENLSNCELGALLTTLQLPNNMRHKLGMGKPLGMGSVKIKPTLHLIDRKKRYETFSCNNDEKSPEDTSKIEQAAIKDFKDAILNHTGKKVKDLWEIPRIEGLAALLEWGEPPPFEETRYVGIEEGGRDNQWKKRKILPTPQKLMGWIEPVTVQNTTEEPIHNPLSISLDQPGKVTLPPRYSIEDKVDAKVISNDGMKVTVALEDGTLFPLDKPYFPHREGETIKVKITGITPDGQKVTKISLLK